MNRQQQSKSLEQPKSLRQSDTSAAKLALGVTTASLESVEDEYSTTEVQVESERREPVQRRQRHRRETRAQLLERLLNPQISLREASILLRVCPTTVRNYTKSGLLPHVRTAGRQRRFYLRDVLVLLRELDGGRK